MKPQNLELGKITGVFESKEKAEEVFDTLRDRGYDASEINLVMTDETRARFYQVDSGIARSEMGDRLGVGAGAGGLTGGLLGALVGSGIPEEHAQEYEERIKEGGTAIAIQPRSAEDAEYIRDLFSQNSTGQVYDEHYQSRNEPSSDSRNDSIPASGSPESGSTSGSASWGHAGDSDSPGARPETPSPPLPNISDVTGKAPSPRRPADGVDF